MSTETADDQRLKLAEDRRKAAEASLWQLPSVSIAAQAFLLNAGLGEHASDRTRLVVGILGLAAVLATAAVVAFQGVRTTVLARWIEQRIGTLDERKLASDELDKRRLNWWQERLLRWLPTPFYFWAAILLGFVVADALLIANKLVPV